MRPVFVGNFEYETRQSELDRLFSKYGRIERVDMKSGFAFVYFEDERDAEEAIHHLDNRPFGYDRRRLSVEWAKGERGRHHDGSKSLANQRPTKTLFVINFDPVHTKVRDIERHFEPYGKVLHVRIRRNFAFVQFDTQEEATKALQATHLSKILDRVVSVEYALRDDSERGDVERGDRYRDSPPRRGSYGRRGDSPYGRSPSPGYRRRPSPDYGRPRSPVYDRYNGPVYDRRRSRNQDFDRHRDYDQDRGRRHRHRSRSRSRSHSRDRSPSHSRSKSKRTSGFDMAPPAGSALPNASVSGQLSGIPQTMPGVVQNSLPFGALHMALPLMPAQAMTQQATRHARRVYVGGLPLLANEQTIATFFSQVMAAIGGNSVGSITELAGDAVVNVYINHEKKFAFVEMRTVEEASNAMALDGIIFEGVAVRVRRPTDYNPTLAATLGPSQPSPHLNLAAVGLTQGAVGGAEGPDRIFVGGLPYYFTEAQIRELLQSFGPLRGFDLVKDKDTGNSKGYGFCVYQDPTVTDVACGALNGLKMGDKTLTVRRATASNGQSKTEQENILVQAQQHIAMQKMAMQVVDLNLLGAGMATMASGETPTKVLCLTEAITADQLGDDEEYVEILEDMRDECSKFGTLVNVVIPRADQSGEQIPGVGKVFLEYTDIGGCANARNVLGGRKFGGNTVNAVYYPEEKYHNRDYSA